MIAPGPAIRERPGEGDPDHEHEGRLDQVPQGASDPGSVIALVPEETQNPVGREFPRDLREAEATGCHEQHHGAAKRVE
jgi:hypothetical protein